MSVRLLINGKSFIFDGDPHKPLLWVLREDLGLTGTKYGCGVAACGACTVHVDGIATRSCSLPVEAAEGTQVLTIEGLAAANGNDRHPLQDAWIAGQVPQCGYCQSGMVMAAAALLSENPRPSDEEVLTAIRDRDVYGALVASPQGAELLIATGASPAVAQMLRSAVSQLAPEGVAVTGREVIPPPRDDPTGSGLAVGLLPLVMTASIAGLAGVFLLRRTSHRTGVVLGLSVVAGVVAAAIIQPVLGITDGSYFALAGVIALIVGAVSATVVGLGAVLGRGGVGGARGDELLRDRCHAPPPA
jgi:isoquinoline 1-oxidoreductase subunit alpha